MNPLQNAAVEYFKSKGWSYDGNTTNTLTKSFNGSSIKKEGKEAVIVDDQVCINFLGKPLAAVSLSRLLKEKYPLLKYFIEN